MLDSNTCKLDEVSKWVYSYVSQYANVYDKTGASFFVMHFGVAKYYLAYDFSWKLTMQLRCSVAEMRCSSIFESPWLPTDSMFSFWRLWNAGRMLEAPRSDLRLKAEPYERRMLNRGPYRKIEIINVYPN